MPKTQIDALLGKHKELTHSDDMKVVSHVQREDGDWWLHTLMIENVDIPFKYKRKKPYKALKGARVNMTYYLSTEEVAGISFDYMKVVRLKRS